MIRSDQILNTVEMIQKEHLDVRAVTMGISLLDCRAASASETAQRIHSKICWYAENLVETCDRIGVINKGRLIAMGTTKELQREANITEADLERVFLNLTNNNS